MAAALALATELTSFAISARGHGHWPNRLIDSSSMSTTRTSRSAPGARGRQR